MKSDKARVTVLITDSLEDPALQRAITELGKECSIHVLSSPQSLPLAPLEKEGVRYWAAIDSGQMNWCLSMLGTPDLIKILSSSVPLQEIVDRVFLHLAPGGQLVVDESAYPSEADFKRFAAWVLGIKRLNLDPQAQTEITDRHRRLAKFVGDIDLHGRVLTMEKRGSHILKVRDADATRLLLTRNQGEGVEELEVLRSHSWLPEMKVESFPQRMNLPQPGEKITVPDRYLRAYTGNVRMIERCLTLQGNVALPQSFRFHLENNLSNPILANIDKDFGQIQGNWNHSWEELPGTYYDLDCSNSGHFGHLTTEVLSRFWGWEAAKEKFPDLKALFRIRRPAERDPALERMLLNAYGITDEDIVWSPVPVKVDRLIAATPMWHNQFPHYADPLIKEIWSKMGDRLVSADGPKEDKIFVSRRPTFKNRACLNTSEIEKVFLEAGFLVVYPEDLPLAAQASLFRNARVVAGFGGSGLFNVMYAEKLEHLIVLNHEAYTARNEYLYAAVLGVDITYFWSKPEISHPQGGWSEQAYFSNWNFDFAKLGKTLRKTLKSA